MHSSALSTEKSVILKIERIIQTILEDLAQHRTLSIPVASRPCMKPVDDKQLPEKNKPAARLIKRPKFPGVGFNMAWKFVAVKILEVIHHGLIDNFVTTKRNIYYKDPSLFLKQSVVDKFVDDLAYSLCLNRYELNVCASAKGLVYGRVSILREDGSICDVSSDPEGTLIPMLKHGDVLELSNVSWVLVIEKEACFRELVEMSFQDSFLRNGIIVTGKGYPDISTRAFVKRIRRADPVIPIYALVDWDADGIAIFMTYAYGSLALAHESPALENSSMNYLGVKSEDLFKRSTQEVTDLKAGNLSSTLLTQATNLQEAEVGCFSRELVTLPMTFRDRKKATTTLRRGFEHCKKNCFSYSCQRELQVLLILNTKAEIQGLSAFKGGLQGWLAVKIETRKLRNQ